MGNSVGALLEGPPWAGSIRITWESVRSLRPPVDLLNQNPLVGAGICFNKPFRHLGKPLDEKITRNSLVVQWLELDAFSAEGIPV